MCSLVAPKFSVYNIHVLYLSYLFSSSAFSLWLSQCRQKILLHNVIMCQTRLSAHFVRSETINCSYKWILLIAFESFPLLRNWTRVWSSWSKFSSGCHYWGVSYCCWGPKSFSLVLWYLIINAPPECWRFQAFGFTASRWGIGLSPPFILLLKKNGNSCN